MHPETQLSTLLGGQPLGPCALIVAHPGDETLGAGALLENLEQVHIYFLTNGVPRERRFWPELLRSVDGDRYASIRRSEALEALGVAGVPEDRIHWLGAEDQELIRDAVPIGNALGAELAVLRPELVLSQPYAGGHPDHDACALIAASVIKRLNARAVLPSAVSPLEMTAYHLRDGKRAFGEFLPGSNPGSARKLSDADIARRQRMLAAYVSQQLVLADVPLSEERFRLAPRYDFAAPPHPGPLLYEELGFPLPGAEWRKLAAVALKELGAAD